MADQIAFINLRPLWARAPLALLAAAALYLAWNCAVWGVANTMAETAPVSYENDPAASLESAEAAVRLSPNDPATHLMVARLSQLSFAPEGVARSLSEYERAAVLAPNDYLVWLEAGRAHAALGDYAGGIAMLRRSVELAPNYAQPRWHLGNALMRSGDIEAAFAELRRAADADSTLRPQVFNLAWQVYAPDMARVIDVVGKTPEARAQLVGVLTSRQRFNDALAVWESIGDAERQERRESGVALARALYERGMFHLALRTLREAGSASDELSVGKVFNGSFEQDIERAGTQLFHWDVSQIPNAQIAIDGRTAAAGRRSLRIVFNSSGQLEFYAVSQVVPVEQSARYRLTYALKTEELRSVATLLVTVNDAGPPESRLPATSNYVDAPTGTNNWQRQAIEFTTGPKTEGVVIRITRQGCAEGACPIYGKIWYDDFNLERVGDRPDAR